jgi:hypothetical protein
MRKTSSSVGARGLKCQTATQKSSIYMNNGEKITQKIKFGQLQSKNLYLLQAGGEDLDLVLVFFFTLVGLQARAFQFG